MHVKKPSLYFLVLGMMAVVFIVALGGGLFGQQESFFLQWQHQLFADLCHQMPSRSFWIGGQPMAVCSRCFGIYSGFLTGWILLPIISLFNFGKTIPYGKMLLLIGIINLIDILGNLLGVWQNTAVSRLVLGGLAGTAAATLFSGSFFIKTNKTGNIMEESQQVQSNNPSYWTSIAIASLLFGIIAFAISMASNYATINSEPTGSLFSPIQLIGILACLFSAFGGMLATWHYAKEYDVAIKLGKGALIGFLTGVGIAIVSVILSQIWMLIDPDMIDKMVDSTVASMEAMDLPGEQKDALIDSSVQGIKSQQNIGTALLWGIPLNGIFNLITGMIGAKIFGKKEEEF